MQKLKNNEARPKFTGSYKKKRVVRNFVNFILERVQFVYVQDFFSVFTK